jgi:hypothetical protein
VSRGTKTIGNAEESVERGSRTVTETWFSGSIGWAGNVVERWSRVFYRNDDDNNNNTNGYINSNDDDDDMIKP